MSDGWSGAKVWTQRLGLRAGTTVFKLKLYEGEAQGLLVSLCNFRSLWVYCLGGETMNSSPKEVLQLLMSLETLSEALRSATAVVEAIRRMHSETLTRESNSDCD